MKHTMLFVAILLAGLSLVACGKLEVNIEPFATTVVKSPGVTPSAVPALATPTPTSPPVASITDTPSPTATAESSVIEGQQVVAWPGYIYCLPAESGYGDAVGFLGQEHKPVGYAGVTGATPEIETQIVALRDRSDVPLNLWGTLRCPADDYEGCQLVVTRIQDNDILREGFPEPDPVEGWEGTLACAAGFNAAPGTCTTTSFTLAGKTIPVTFDTWCLDEAIQKQAEGLRDTGTVVRVWGEITPGVPSFNWAQIKVVRLEVVQ